jgi:hypothetical protein
LNHGEETGAYNEHERESYLGGGEGLPQNAAMIASNAASAFQGTFKALAAQAEGGSESE